MTTETEASTTAEAVVQIQHMAAAVDDRLQGRDAAVLMRALSTAADSDPMLIAVEPDLSMMLPYADWRDVRRQTKTMLARLRDELAPDARIAADRDISVAHGIERLVARNHRQLLIVGSSRDGTDGKVSIAHTTRQLMHDLSCPIAIAPSGLSTHTGFELRRIAVGFDGGHHARGALQLAVQLAQRGNAELVVHAVVNDQIPTPGWATMWVAPFRDEWDKAVGDQVNELKQQLTSAVEGVDVEIRAEVVRGIPSQSLTELSADVDLIVIGSRRWGAAARLLLGSSGEALARTSQAALLLVPAPAHA